MFGVIVCPRCHTVRGVDLSSRSGSCPRCGHQIDVTRAKVYFRTDSQKELATAVRQKAEEIAVTLDDPLGVEEIRERMEGPERESADMRRERVHRTAVRLTKEQGSFTVEGLMGELGMDRQQTERMMEDMIQNGLVYQPREGIYKATPLTKG
ncbi:MAG: hypothetical protein ACLFUV_03265 [Methanomassiliicoccales archaeon]